MINVGVCKAKARFSELINLVLAGEDIVITRRGGPVARLVPVVGVHLIRSEEDYEAALSEIEDLMAARAGTPDGDRLRALVSLVEAWEAEHYPITSTTSLP